MPKHWVAGIGFEPMTFGLWARRASRLLHPAINVIFLKEEWAEVDSNHRSKLQQIYSLSPLATRESAHLSQNNIKLICFTLQLLESWKPMIGLEPITCWLQISCSANWATSAYIISWFVISCSAYNWLVPRQLSRNESHRHKKWKLQGSNLWPSACKADALPAELNFH